jgi:hypothetical protein
MTHPILAHARCFGVAAIVMAVAVTDATAQETLGELIETYEMAEPEIDPVTGEEIVSADDFSETTMPERDIRDTPQSAEEEMEFLTRFEPLDYDVILSDNAAIARYVEVYRQAQDAAQAIYEAEAAFNTLRALTPEEAEDMFPDGDYDDALNAANDALYWAVEDGNKSGASLREARFTLTGGPVSDEQAAELDRLLGL